MQFNIRMTTVYAVQMLSVLEYFRRESEAKGEEPEIIRIKLIQEHCGIGSRFLLEQVARVLRVVGITTTTKGPQGGCKLRKSLKDVKVKDLELPGGEGIPRKVPKTPLSHALVQDYDKHLQKFYDTPVLELPYFGTAESIILDK